MSLLKVAGAGMRTLKGISFEQERLQKIAIAGTTGSGKTTLLKMIAGLLQPDSGEIWFEGKRVTGPTEQLVPGFTGIAYLSQDFELRNNYRVEEVLEYANILLEETAATLYEVCQISQLLQRKTDQLSGGERQRIALARLLGSSPRLLLLDEPFSNLDPAQKNNIKTVIRDIGEKLNITCILVSHDGQDTLPWADKILVLEDGQIRQQGSPEQIYRQPVNEYVAGLFGPYHLIDARQARALYTRPGIIRPEGFSLSARDNGGVKGTVTHVSFAGSFSATEVSLPGFTITVNTPSGRFTKGSIVYISIDYDNYPL